MPVALAGSTSDIYIAGQTGYIESMCLYGGQPYNTTANVSITYPNQSIYINTALLSKGSDDVYRYTFTVPSITGTYAAVVECKGLGIGLTTFQVKDLEDEVGMGGVALLLGLLLLTGSLFYLAYRHNKMGGYQKLLAPVLHVLGIVSLNIPLLYISNKNIIDPFGDTLLIICLVFTTIYTLVYLPLSVLALIKEYMEEQTEHAARGIRRTT